MSLLAVEALDVHHGLLHAVRSVSLDIAEGERLALVGANGAGKTTLLRTIAGAQRPSSGSIRFAGEPITTLPAHKRVRLGIALVPEGRKLFADLTVEENLLVAARHRRPQPGPQPGPGPQLGSWTVDGVLDVFPMLRKLRAHRAGTLSGGEQQATAIGRALMTNPRLLLLDEVSLGLSPIAVDAVYQCLDAVLGEEVTVVLVEQDLARALGVAARVVCLLEGRIVLDEPSTSVTREQVTEAYFGLAGRQA